MWLFEKKAIQAPEPLVPASDIAVTNKEGDESVLDLDWAPGAGMSAEDRAILIEDTKKMLADLKEDKVPAGWDPSVLDNPETKAKAIDEVQDALNTLLNEAAEPLEEPTPEPVPAPSPEANTLAKRIDMLLDEPAKFKKLPQLANLADEEFNKAILQTLKLTVDKLNSELKLYYRDDEVRAKLQNL